MSSNLLIRNATIHTMEKDSKPFQGDLLLKNGRIASIGESLEVPQGAEVLEGRSLIATPGLIDVHTHMGSSQEGYPEREASDNEMTDPTTPQVRIIDSINPRDRAFQDARESGVTMIQALPGSGNVIGGECAILSTVGDDVEDMIVRAPSGMKAAFGENPKGVYGGKDKFPSTRMGVAACLRNHLVEARNYGLNLEYQKKEGEPQERDLAKEALLRVLSGDVPLRIHAHRADDIATALRIVREFSCTCTLEHGTEGHLAEKAILQSGVSVAFGPFLSSRPKLELAFLEPCNGVELYRKGVPMAIITDHPVVPIGFIMAQAGRLVRDGLSSQEVLGMLTRDAATHLGLQNETGTLTDGKRADVVLWDGDPLAYTTSVVATIIEGTVVYRKK